MAHSIDGLDIAAYPYGVTSAPQLPGPPQVLSMGEYATSAGGRISRRRTSTSVFTYTGEVEGATALAMEANLDALMKRIYKPDVRIVAGFQDSRYVIANLEGPVEVASIGPFNAAWKASFRLATPYKFAPLPSASVSTPTLAATYKAGEYITDLSLTPGGGAPTPLRLIIANQSGGITPTRLGVNNLTQQWPAEGGSLANTAGGGLDFAAGQILTVDTERQLWEITAAAAFDGYYPLWEASGAVQDFSTNSRNLTAGGAPAYLQDGPLGPSIGFNGSTAFTLINAAFQYTGSFTVGAWVNPTAAGVWYGIMSYGGGLHKGWALYRFSDNTFRFQIGNNTTERTLIGSPQTGAGQWYFVEGVHDTGANLDTLLVNGQIEAQTSGAFGVVAGTSILNIGAVEQPDANIKFWNGYIQHAFLKGAALTQAQSATIYRGLPPDYNAVRSRPDGTIFPMLHPELGTTNTVRVTASHATTAATLRVGASWRSLFP